jgi:hypothetical protein
VSDQAAFQEVDDAVRQDDLKAWWKRYGTWVLGAVVIAVVAAAGVVGWRQYQTSQRAQSSQAYSAALAKVGQDNKAAREEFDKLAQTAVEPYRSLAALASAQYRDTPEEQVAALEAVAPKLSAELSDLALTIAGFRGLDSPKADEIVSKLDALAQPERAFHGSAMELQALVAARKGDLKKARELWTSLAKDAAGPPGAAQRAQAMLNYYGEAEAK